MLKYRQIDHTADVGLRIFGATRSQLFENAAEGLFDILTDLSKVRSSRAFALAVTSTDCEGLLVDWLSELNYLFLTQRLLFREFDVQELTEERLTATAFGEEFDADRHEIYTEVKAVTYHALYIRRFDSGYEAQVIFDL